MWIVLWACGKSRLQCYLIQCLRTPENPGMQDEKSHILSFPLHFFVCSCLCPLELLAMKGRGETRKVSLLLSNIDLDCRRELLQSTVHKHIFGITSSSSSQYPPSGQNSIKGQRPAIMPNYYVSFSDFSPKIEEKEWIVPCSFDETSIQLWSIGCFGRPVQSWPQSIS